MDEIVERLSAIAILHYERRSHQTHVPTQEEVLCIQEIATQVFRPPTSDASSQPEPPLLLAPSAAFREFEELVWGLNRNMDVYEKHDLLDKAMDEIPIQELHEKAEQLSAQSHKNHSSLAFEDALAEPLVQWFKHTYMRWINSFPCPICSGPTTVIGATPPTPEERVGRANRVELHKCQTPNCGGLHRFPRYNDPAMLMKTREGRCGEWANLFTLFLRAVGLRARYIWNREDHVWNEYFSPTEQRWVHIDSCEAARDKPTLYERGWGKKMSYIFAFSVEGALDVSRGYTLNWPAMEERRNWVPIDELQRVMQSITSTRRASLSSNQRAHLEAEDRVENARLQRGPDWTPSPEQGRQSGSTEWTHRRGEAG
ncbi:hypothetical protein DACRYDRAFT_75589 [Dacryopinax primogenitus]|uniref:Transglutaminase-like domain-containing protein n=1 Tax=Dacryopinax primogenitus (strain DJM 731) TaxID=1858805 RepID=M5G3C3_DACPD|nr:uncharacterized protein DACRYDRAFT_75589 [Dacryopinax primogenitus]EJU04706.1 hypothetical protein DACRYDRAFT_75589 [Dacryopinax primogenitus]